VNDHSELKIMLAGNEGSIQHMYLDTVGKVTVGVGHMIPNVGEA
jgi:GH24 family phage-related lysozyme (muramidase)